jgi:hypothetical protein
LAARAWTALGTPPAFRIGDRFLLLDAVLTHGLGMGHGPAIRQKIEQVGAILVGGPQGGSAAHRRGFSARRLGKGMERLLHYFQAGVEQAGGTIRPNAPDVYEVSLNGDALCPISTNRDLAKEQENMSLLGLEHPLVRRLMDVHRDIASADRGLAGRLPSSVDLRGVITFWRVEICGGKGQVQQRVATIGLNAQGERSRPLEQLGDALLRLEPGADPLLDPTRRADLVRNVVPDMIRRYLTHAGILTEGSSFSARLLA